MSQFMHGLTEAQSISHDNALHVGDSNTTPTSNQQPSSSASSNYKENPSPRDDPSLSAPEESGFPTAIDYTLDYILSHDRTVFPSPSTPTRIVGIPSLTGPDDLGDAELDIYVQNQFADLCDILATTDKRDFPVPVRASAFAGPSTPSPQPTVVPVSFSAGSSSNSNQSHREHSTSYPAHSAELISAVPSHHSQLTQGDWRAMQDIGTSRLPVDNRNTALNYKLIVEGSGGSPSYYCRDRRTGACFGPVDIFPAEKYLAKSILAQCESDSPGDLRRCPCMEAW